MSIIHKSNGFTLIELLIVMLISLILMTGIYSTYQSQQRAYMIQDQVAAMQQNVRAALHFIERDLMMAGFDPNRTGSAGVTAATNNSITFTFFENFEDNDPSLLNLETITYSLYDALIASNENDTLVDDLGRLEAGDGTTQPVAINIDAIDFVYLDANGDQLGDTDNDNITDNMSGQLGNIRSIEVTLVGKTNDLAEGIWVDTGYTNTNVYTNARGATVLDPDPDDNLRRLSLTKRVRCRNLGL